MTHFIPMSDECIYTSLALFLIFLDRLHFIFRNDDDELQYKQVHTWF